MRCALWRNLYLLWGPLNGKMKRPNHRLPARWMKEDYERSISSRGWYGTPYGGGWTELAIKEGLPEDEELRGIFFEEMELKEVPNWAKSFVKVYLNEPWLPYCGHYTFPSMLLQSLACIGKGRISRKEMTARCYRVEPERRELLAKYLFCIDAWLKGASLKQLGEWLNGLEWSGRNWVKIAQNIYGALGERDDEKTILLRRIIHRQRWWLRTLLWVNDKPLNEKLGYYYGKTYLDKEGQTRVDEDSAEFEDPEVIELETEIKKRFDDADKWLSMIRYSWLCGPKAFRYLERQLLHVGQKSLLLSSEIVNQPILMYQDTYPRKEWCFRWYKAFRSSLNSWLEGNNSSDVQHAQSEVARQIVRLLGRPTPVKHWLVRLLRHKLDLYEKHSGFDILVRPHGARARTPWGYDTHEVRP